MPGGLGVWGLKYPHSGCLGVPGLETWEGGAVLGALGRSEGPWAWGTRNADGLGGPGPGPAYLRSGSLWPGGPAR